ncbi:fatty acid desaturase family protein [Yersinia similis]|uniref:Fatty acid desaturase n=1 Tax=Yersinia similis TaxID=367190 RepID=A0A0T9QQW3_9GAMM|nr:acyl-CoA desaturase [Yersinia similis]CNF41135.1 Fatty acid desaturase [Yersinia similis]CNI23965.1 Fatty acid desaturase [Yersinia similis]
MKGGTPLRPLAFQRNDMALHKALMQAAQHYLASHHDHRFADGWSISKMVFLAILCLGCYGLSLQSFALPSIVLQPLALQPSVLQPSILQPQNIQQSGIWDFFFSYLGFIFTGMLLTVNVVHDASHNAFFRTRWANVLINRLVAIPVGLDPDCWRVRHVIFHHTHTNIEHYDPDIDENGVLRQTPFQRWKPFMRAQHFYWPLVAAMTFPWYIWLVDWLDRAGKTRVTTRMDHQGGRGWGIFLFSKGAHLLLALVIPSVVLSGHISFMTILAVYLLCQMLSSWLFVMLIVGTHWAKAKFFQAPEQGSMPHNGYQHIFATTFDWHTQPRWIGYWLGGANLHLTHHLFPHWNHRHYPALSQIISAVAARFAMDYQNLSLREVLYLQHCFLREMGINPQVSSDKGER